MKLLFVIHSLKMGGAERVLSIMANHFANSGYEVDICVFEGEDIFYEIDKKIKIHDLELGAVSSSQVEAVLNNFGRILKLRNKIKEIKPDVAVSFLTHTNIVSILAAKTLRLPVIACEHSNYDFLKSRVWRAVRKVVYPLSSVVTILTNADAVNYKKIKHLEVLPNPLTPFEPSGAVRQKIVLGVGRLTHSKGFERLIKAFNAADTKDWRLIIVGEGDEKEALLRLAASSPKNKFIALAGAQKDVASFYFISSLFVLSSREEGFPMVLCEAMSCGCASIAFDCKTGPSEIITDGEDGVLIREGDVRALIASLSLMIADDEKRERIANEATKIKDKLGVLKIAAKWEEIFAKLEK